jgi:transcriptional regulator with XRE-family HTH domain
MEIAGHRYQEDEIKTLKSRYSLAKSHAVLTTGETIRMLRELKGWTQADLARRSGISVTDISLLENEKVEIGKKRAEQLAKSFDVHPAIIVSPDYEAKEIEKADLYGAGGGS